MLVYLLTLLSALYVSQVASACPPEPVKITSASGAVGLISLNTTQGAVGGLDCRWLLSNVQSCPNGSPIVMLEWVFINTTDVKDMIIIYDGDSRDSRILQQVSGTKLELSKNTTGKNALVNFLSDEHVASGFAIRYRFLCGPFIPPAQGCRPLSAPSILNLTYQGKIDFTDDQRNLYQDCAWVVSNDLTCSNPYVEFEFSNFSALFPYDYLDLYDGTSRNQSNQIGHYQGSKVYYGPGYQRSIGKQILIVFHNEYAHPGTEWTGFSASFRARCDAKPQPNCALREEPMIINKTTPNYMVYSPAHYRPNAACYWLFQNPNKTCAKPVVLMIFPVFRTIELYDSVSLYNGPLPFEANRIGKWSGFMPDAVPQGFIKSEGPNVLMEFHSGALYNDDSDRGFTVQFAFPCEEDLPKVPEESCPKYLQTNPPPPRAPGLLDFTASSYRNNLDCGWVWLNNRTDCPSGSQPVVQLEFLRFETEAKFDYVNIYDGPVSREGREGVLAYDDYFILGSYSGSKGWEIPTVVRSTQPSIMLTFHSDGTVSDSNDDGNHNDGIQVQASHVCSNDPIPTTVRYDCRGDNGMPYARFWTPDVTLQNPRVTFEHHYLPFNLAYPTIIEQFFSDPVPSSMLASRGAGGVEGEVVIGTDLIHPGENATWRCCGELNTSRPVRGSILVCERGDCLFVQKVQTGQRYGAAGVIVVDTTETGVRMGSTIDVSDVTIPSVSTISSIGVMLTKATARARVFARLASFTCPEGTFSPTITPMPLTDEPSPLSPVSAPSQTPRAPTPPTPPTEALPTTTLYFTLPIETIRFTQDVRDRFMNNLNSFFLWVPGTATLSSFEPDPNDASSTVAEVEVDVQNAELALARWGTASPPDKLVLSSPDVASLSRHEPHKRCMPMDCESTSLRTAQWDPIKCSCSRFITGSGSFVMIILPIFLILLLILFLCCCCAPCPLYGRWKKKGGHEKVAMDDMHLQDVHMMPRDVKDSEESMRGEGQPYDTEDPPAEQRDWDEEDRRHGSELVRSSQAEPIRISRPRSDDSDDEEETRPH